MPADHNSAGVATPGTVAMTVLICKTCPRYDLRRSGQFAAALADALNSGSPATRGVQCLGGCPRDGVVALDGPGKVRVRFTGLTVGDGSAIAAAAQAYDESASGHPDDWEIPPAIRGRLSSVTLKRSAGHTPAAR
jgi:predicted metal-binding protein